MLSRSEQRVHWTKPDGLDDAPSDDRALCGALCGSRSPLHSPSAPLIVGVVLLCSGGCLKSPELANAKVGDAVEYTGSHRDLVSPQRIAVLPARRGLRDPMAVPSDFD